MSLYSILVTNNAPGCNTEIEQQLSVTGCTSYIVRLTSNSNALGPFNIYIDDVIYLSAVTRNEMLNGVVVTLECGTPTPTQTPTNTPTPSITPTQTQTPSETPTNTPTPSITPTQTQTPSETPTQTPTPTFTPTPSSTPQIFEIVIVYQNGDPIFTQDGLQLITQQEGYSFSVTSGSTNGGNACILLTYSQILYSSSSTWDDATDLFADSSLITPFNGGNSWYSNGLLAKQINSSGLVIDTYYCPV
jgi:hypothetical protein